MDTPDFRSLCAELLAALEPFIVSCPYNDRPHGNLVYCARAALAADADSKTDSYRPTPITSAELDARLNRAFAKAIADGTIRKVPEHAPAPVPEGGASDDEIFRCFTEAQWDAQKKVILASATRSRPISTLEARALAKQHCLAGLRAVLARYGTPAPVPVAKRLPEPSDYKDGHCWWWNDDQSYWEWGWLLTCHDDGNRTHWLPHWALPLPEVQP